MVAQAVTILISEVLIQLKDEIDQVDEEDLA
jgi:hypothetical protein